MVLASRTDTRSVTVTAAVHGRGALRAIADKASSSQRTHAQMDHDGSSSPSWSSLNRVSASREPSASASHPHVSGLHLPRIGMPSGQPRRYPGDGFDFRRPVLSSQDSSQSQVIDLTVDDAGPSASSSNRQADSRAQRPPRFAREIIDVDNDDAPHLHAPPDSPEIQFISSRPIAPLRRPNPPPVQVDVDVDEDDIEIVGSNQLPGAQRRRGFDLNLEGIVGLYDMGPYLRRRVEGEHMERRRHTPIPAPGRQIRTRPARIGFVVPDLNFGLTAFDMGMGAAHQPPPPTYEAPTEAPEGFTRSAAESDVLLCPNCDEELCVGDTEQKRQVWIVKHCGHVCQTHRLPTLASTHG